MLQSTIPVSKMMRQFANVEHIGSSAIRGQLKETISDIFSTAAEVKDFSEDLSEVASRYMKFLESSCTTKELINKRAAWLTTYGSIVLGRMIAYKNRSVIYGKNNSLTSSAEDEAVINMITAIQSYESTVGYGKRAPDDEVIAAIEDLLMVIDEQGDDQNKFSFAYITDEIVELTEIFTGLSKQGIRSTYAGTDEYLIIALRHLGRKMRYYGSQFQIFN